MLYGKFNGIADKAARGEFQKLTKWSGETDHFKKLNIIMDSFRIFFLFLIDQFTLKYRLVEIGLKQEIVFP